MNDDKIQYIIIEGEEEGKLKAASTPRDSKNRIGKKRSIKP